MEAYVNENDLFQFINTHGIDKKYFYQYINAHELIYKKQDVA